MTADALAHHCAPLLHNCVERERIWALLPKLATTSTAAGTFKGERHTAAIKRINLLEADVVRTEPGPICSIKTDQGGSMAVNVLPLLEDDVWDDLISGLAEND